MNIIEILKQIFSATDEQTTAFSTAMKENNIFTTSHENMDVRYPKMKTDYEGKIQKLTEQLAQEKLNAAIKVGLLSEKAVDVDYLTFKLNEKLKGDGEALTLDDNGNIKGWKDKVDGLRTQFPNMFEAVSDGSNPDGYEVVPLPLRKGSGGNDAVSPEAFRNMSYEQRLALKQNNEAQYNTLRKQVHN